MEIIDRLIDLVETTEPTCIVGVNTSVAYEDEEGKPEAFACDVALQWYADGLQCELSTAFCSINIPEEGKGYDPETIYVDGTDNGWEYWINVAGLSEDDEEELVSLMKDKFYQYNLTQDGCVIEHYCV